MHLDSARDLYNFYSLENKSDAYIAYLYLKHVDHFMKHVYAMLDFPARELDTEPVGETVDDILRAYAAQIGEAAVSFETNIYHAKLVTLKDAIQLVTQKNPLALPPVNEHVLPSRSRGTSSWSTRMPSPSARARAARCRPIRACR